MKTLNIIGKKYTQEILDSLLVVEYKRFLEIQREVKISPKILAQRLRQMVSIGAVNKNVVSTLQRRTEYSLTDKGFEILKIIIKINNI